MSIYANGGKVNLTLADLRRRDATQQGRCWEEIQDVLLREIERFDFPENAKALLKEIIKRSQPIRPSQRPARNDWFEVGNEVETRLALLRFQWEQGEHSKPKHRPTITNARKAVAKNRSLPERAVADLHKKYLSWERKARKGVRELGG